MDRTSGTPPNPERRTTAERRRTSRGGRRHADRAALEDALRDTESALRHSGPDAPLALVVDDFQDGREMVCEYLRCRGFRVAEAATGAEAVEKVATLRPDIVLLDFRLPDIDGLEVLARLRQGPHPHVKVAIFTAHVTKDIRPRVMAAGATMFFPKPADLGTVVLEITRVLSLRASSSVRAG